jgi:hypothetical protein
MVTEVANSLVNGGRSQLAVLSTGMCAAGFNFALLLPLRQLSPPTALAGAWAYCTLSQLLVERWQLSQLPVTLEWVAVAGLLAKPYAPVKWQLAHCVVIDTLRWKRPGFQLA